MHRDKCCLCKRNPGSPCKSRAVLEHNALISLEGKVKVQMRFCFYLAALPVVLAASHAQPEAYLGWFTDADIVNSSKLAAPAGALNWFPVALPKMHGPAIKTDWTIPANSRIGKVWNYQLLIRPSGMARSRTVVLPIESSE